MWRVTARALAVLLLAWFFGNFVLGWFRHNNNNDDDAARPRTQHSEQPSGASHSPDQSCLCHLTGVLDDCFCDVESIDVFNNFKLYPRIKKLTEKDYFRYYRFSQQANTLPDVTDCEQAKELGAINSTLSNQTKEAFADWARHDDAQDHFCELDDETSPDAEYVDLLLNPERFTGYKGSSAWRVWNSIYEENCFKPRSVYRPLNPLAPSRGESTAAAAGRFKGLCLEKRVFYRLISGLHSSINIHLCAEYLLDERWGRSVWGPNVQEFRQRFDTAETKGEGTRRLKNLYFLYLIELRALYKVSPYFERAFINLYTGNSPEDSATKELLLQVFNEIKSFPMHFDEKSMFAGHKIEAKTLKEEFRLHFKNISRIMDCVGCSKCRLWGKLQTQGLGTALKILFSEKEIQNLPERSPSQGFQLTRQEIVALINGFGRLSTSIQQLHNFRLLLKENRKWPVTGQTHDDDDDGGGGGGGGGGSYAD
ncbi:hypothetical protein F2P81_009803 [Scophthalmus maximus]|uniref:ERO1-like protein beta n=1 Tax=Scophthalmus maximus TaxID=52904 RepID=A0A6A4SW68_SCOMX|nr:hypothetical protein F2P81_009803 [Scophthalmus maximus]